MSIKKKNGLRHGCSGKSDKSMFCCKAKQMQCLTNYRISTKERHIHTQDHQDVIREEGLWLGFSEARYLFICFVQVVYLDNNKY